MPGGLHRACCCGGGGGWDCINCRDLTPSKLIVTFVGQTICGVECTNNWSGNSYIVDEYPEFMGIPFEVPQQSINYPCTYRLIIGTYRARLWEGWDCRGDPVSNPSGDAQIVVVLRETIHVSLDVGFFSIVDYPYQPWDCMSSWPAFPANPATCYQPYNGSWGYAVGGYAYVVPVL